MSNSNEQDNRYWTQRSRERYDRDENDNFWNRHEAELERLYQEDSRRDIEGNRRGASRLSDSWD